MGPTSLWEALTVYPSTAGDLTRLGQAALDRGLYRHAAILWTTAVAGSTDAAGRLIALVHQVSPGDAARAAQWAVTHASLDDSMGRRLADLQELRETGAEVQALVAWAAGHVSLVLPDAQDKRGGVTVDEHRVCAFRAFRRVVCSGCRRVAHGGGARGAGIAWMSLACAAGRVRAWGCPGRDLAVSCRVPARGRRRCRRGRGGRRGPPRRSHGRRSRPVRTR